MFARNVTALAAAALITAACSGTGSPTWQDELIELSQSEHARALHYPAALDASTVDSTMDQQCHAIDAALANPAFGDDASVLAQITASIEVQREQRVPEELLRRDFAALDAGMRARCPETHERLSTYFPFDDFEDVLDCEPVAVFDEPEAMIEACAGS